MSENVLLESHLINVWGSFALANVLALIGSGELTQPIRANTLPTLACVYKLNYQWKSSGLYFGFILSLLSHHNLGLLTTASSDGDTLWPPGNLLRYGTVTTVTCFWVYVSV